MKVSWLEEPPITTDNVSGFELVWQKQMKTKTSICVDVRTSSPFYPQKYKIVYGREGAIPPTPTTTRRYALRHMCVQRFYSQLRPRKQGQDFFWSWNSWEQNQGLYMVKSGAIWNDVEDGTAEKTLKARTQNGALWRYLKLFLGRCNCWENFESKEKIWCILMLFETVFWKLELLRKIGKQGS